MRLEEEYKKIGYFWLPGKKENKIPGTLSIVDGGKVELEIVGHFDEDIKVLSGSDVLNRIVGHVEKDGLVTLDDCFYRQKNISFDGISKSKIVVNKVLSGAAWDENEEVTFNTFSFSVDCLDEWVGISGIDVDNDLEKRTATIKYHPPKAVYLQLNNGIKLGICFKYTLPGFPNLTEAKITQRAYFRLESETLCGLNDFISIAYKITNLMCFAMDEVVSLKNVIATSSEIMSDGGGGKEYSVPISIYYQSIPFSEKIPKRTFNVMLFEFGTIKANAQQVFNNWLNLYDVLSPALGLYFSSKAGDYKYLNGKFLALAQGLETYHRRTSSETLMDEESYKNLVSGILEGCPEEHVEWLSGRLMHGNEINLGKRLKSIIEPFKEHFGSSKTRSKLIRKVVDTRNYLTHYSESLHDESAKGKELWVLCKKMEAIFSLHFLKVIGFTDKEIASVVENCYPLQQKLKAT